MASAYPAALDTTATLPSAGAVGANLSTFPHSALTGNVNDAVIAIQTELGTAPSGADTTVKARLDRITPVLGVLNTWTPVVVQGVTVTVTNVRSTYSRVGRAYTLRFQLTCTSAGTAANAIVIQGFPIPTAGSHPTVVGQAMLTDASTGFNYPALLTLASTVTMSLSSSATNGNAEIRLGAGGGFTLALASGDTLSGSFQYEGNAD